MRQSLVPIFRTTGWKYEPFGDVLSNKQVRAASVWRFGGRDRSDWLYEAHEYRGGPGLFLAMQRPGEYPYASQLRKRIDAWCELLPTLTDVKRVWLDCHVPRRLFEATCQLSNLESLHVKWGNVDDLSSLTALSHLRHIHLGSLVKVTDLRPLSSMRQLVSLELENFKRVENFDALATMTKLELLAIDGSMWTEQTIASLEPIGDMRGLRSFSMTNARLKTGSFEPLLSLQNLEGFHAAWWFPDSEFAKLRALPNLEYGNPFERRPA